jgi:FtsH-binding integral membrane protein
MNSVILFLSSFIIVFLLGFQSQVSRDKHWLFAFFISIGIGICQVFAMKVVPGASIAESFFFIIGGAFGISSSIIAHTHWSRWYYSRNLQKHA